MFIDEARIYVKAGDGGDGCNSLYRDRSNRIGRPDGGPGGNGGDVIFTADGNIHTLLDFQYRQHFKGESGSHGSSNHKKGSRGEALNIKVPPGTLIKDAKDSLVLRDLVRPGDSVIVAKGGAGGRGNSRGRKSEKGAPGEERTLRLELKLIADAGIIGYPNAGKSTLISRISGARPKIASYPFTTKEPVLGVVSSFGGFMLVVAEIPGLIEGAHKGRGLGDRFLKHVERTKVLVHLIDIAGTEGRDPIADYINLNRELGLYSKELAKKPQVIALNKADLPSAEDNIRRFRKHFPRKKAFPVSALAGDGIKELLANLCSTIKKLS
ncbi:MAG: GTPase ObgE [Candidatus Omnitrophica bacterium]|nr:GTPase ObgE [Candidatus Omnitrophota bacterium]